MNYDKKCQLLIIGDSTVGKTSILNRYTNGEFNTNYLATVGLDFFKKDEIFDGKTVRIKIWDTAGQERYKSLTQGYFRNAEGILIVFDVSNSETFEHLKYWIQSVKTHIHLDKGQVPAIIIGNKIDIFEREVSKEDGEKYAKEEKMEYFETSAKNGKGVDECIKFLIKKVLKIQNARNGELMENESIKIEEVSKKEKEEKKKKADNCCNKD